MCKEVVKVCSTMKLGDLQNTSLEKRNTIVGLKKMQTLDPTLHIFIASFLSDKHPCYLNSMSPLQSF